MAPLKSLGFLLLVIFVGGNVIAYKKHRNSNPWHYPSTADVCITEECVLAANTMINNMDDSVDPCDDFFQYACGNWLKKTLLPTKEYITGQVAPNSELRNTMRNDIDTKLRVLLDEPTSQGEWESATKAKNYYKSCMNTDKIEERNLIDVMETLNEFGGWPIASSNWLSSSFNLEDSLISMMKYFFELFKPSPLFVVAASNRIKIWPGGSLPFKKVMGETKILTKEAYKNYAAQIAVLFGADPDLATNDVEDMIDFTEKLVNASKSKYESKTITIQELIRISPEIDWMKYFSGILKIGNPDTVINASEPISISNVKYFEKLSDILQATEGRTIQNYMIWRFLEELPDVFPKRFRILRAPYVRIRSPERWIECLYETRFYFSYITHSMFVQRHFDMKAEIGVAQMIGEFKGSLKKVLSEKDWLNTTAKELAIERIDNLESRVGYPSELADESLMNKEVEHVQIHPEKYFKNHLSASMNYFVSFLRLRTPYTGLKIRSWPSFSAYFFDVTPDFNKWDDIMQFPAASLQPPLYNPDYPYYLNYAGIGNFISRQLRKGLGNRVRAPDEIDKMNRKCLVDQYSSFIVPTTNQTLNGSARLGDNMADNSALKHSFMTYKRLAQRKQHWKNENVLPGLKLTTNQLFFLQFAQNMCGKQSPKAYLLRIRNNWKHGWNEHRSRVIGPLQNSNEFSKAFECPIGSYMNPLKKCDVW